MARDAKTTDYLKECMADALIRLMEEKDAERISVTEITAAAGVGRATWFRHFNAKAEALTFKLVRLWDRWTEANRIPVHTRFKLEHSLAFFRFNHSIQELLQTLYKNGMQSCIYDAFCLVMLPQYEASLVERYQSRFYAHGVFGLLEEWVKRDFAETPEQMAEIFFQVMDDRSTVL